MKQGTYPTDLWATDLRAEWLLLNVNDDDANDGPKPGRPTLDDVGEAVVELLQKDECFLEKNLSPDHIQSLPKMKQVRDLSWMCCCFFFLA